LEKNMSQHGGKDETAAGGAETSSVEPTNSPGPESLALPSLADKVEQLEARIRELEQDRDAQYDRYLRERADLENFKKRMQRDRAEALRFASEALIRELLPVVDNLERAIAHRSGNEESVIEGVQMVLRALMDVLERHGVTRIEAEGAAFDPAKHQALAHVHAPDREPNQVVEQHQRGYQLHERLLRPALVTVSGGGAPAVETEGNSD
jgi:molecular chaperone GrpE